jgi:hypothetical protein
MDEEALNAPCGLLGGVPVVPEWPRHPVVLAADQGDAGRHAGGRGPPRAEHVCVDQVGVGDPRS